MNALTHPDRVDRSRRPAAHRRGIVMMLTLLSVILLTAMVMFVINAGRQINRRTVLQHAADAAAIDGAGWVARSLNTVAMNNVNIARLIALVQIVDAMPMATDFTIKEHIATQEALNRQLGSGVSDSWVRDQLQDLNQEITDELNILNPMDQYFRSYDVTRLTFYDAPGGRGEFWEAMHGMFELSQTTMLNLGELAQTNAIRGGEVNLRREDGSSAGFLAPVVPLIPWEQGEFDDFERPVLQGLLPDQVDDEEFNRGPWDTIFGWRYLIGGETPGYWEVTGSTPANPGGRGGVPIGSGGGGGGGVTRRFVATGPREPDAYGTYGPYRWLLDHGVGSFTHDHLPHSRWSAWERRLSDYKLGYLWPGTGPRYVIDPAFETDFDRAAAIADEDRSRIKETWFIAVEMKSRFERGAGGFLSAGSYSFFVNENMSDRNTPRIVRVRGWVDPRNWNTATQVDNWIWRDEWEYQTYTDPAIGIPLVSNGAGGWVLHPVYRIDEFVFMGVNIGEEVEVPNPNNFTSRQDLPAPIDLVHAQVAHNNRDARWRYLSYLSAARLDDSAIAWPSRFSGAKPFPNQVAVAQAHVFNNHSWDLWTQMWQAHLQPVSRIDDWVNVLDNGANAGGNNGGGNPSPYLSTQEVSDMTEYLRNIKQLIRIGEQ